MANKREMIRLRDALRDYAPGASSSEIKLLTNHLRLKLSRFKGQQEEILIIFRDITFLTEQLELEISAHTPLEERKQAIKLLAALDQAKQTFHGEI